MVTDLLEERRNRMRIEVQQILFDGSTDAGWEESSGCTCAWSSRHSLAHTELLREQKLWPSQILTITISQAIERMEKMGDPTMPNQWVCCDYRWHRDPRYRAKRGERLRELQERNGLCIDCVRLATTAANQAHRINHQSSLCSDELASIWIEQDSI
jgi:hypothetical protein